MPTKYYAFKLLGEAAPNGMFRFFDDPNRAPEYFSVENGWVPDGAIWARLAAAEVDDRDLITEAEAAKLAAKWGGTL
jgi:hypothetical protein